MLCENNIIIGRSVETFIYMVEELPGCEGMHGE
jgi:hypothetical protein